MSNKISINPLTLAHTSDRTFITPISILESTTFIRHPNVGSHKFSGSSLALINFSFSYLDFKSTKRSIAMFAAILHYKATI